MARKARPQSDRLTFPLTPRLVEALDDMLEELFKAQRRPSAPAVASQAEILLGRGSSGPGPIEEITLGDNLSIVGTELQVDLTSALNDLDDVDITGLADNDILVWDAGASEWIVMSLEEAGNTIGMWVPLSDGDPVVPEIIFGGDGNVIMVWEDA